jgi:hypothetical protein
MPCLVVSVQAEFGCGCGGCIRSKVTLYPMGRANRNLTVYSIQSRRKDGC